MVTVGEPGSSDPAWSADGTELFYLSTQGRSFTITVARIAESDPFRVLGTEVLSTHLSAPGTFLDRFFAVHPGGERFLVPLEGATSEGRIVFVQDWSSQCQSKRTARLHRMQENGLSVS